jgi:hypothetical protein
MHDCPAPTDLFDRIDASIAAGEWHLIAVDGDDDDPSWAYTVGLSEQFDHPELVVVGSCCCCAGVLLNAVGDRIAAGYRCPVSDGVPVEVDLGEPVRFRPVHPDHWLTSRFAMWQSYYEAKPWVPPPAHAVQVVFVDTSGWFQDDPRSGRWSSVGLDRSPRVVPSRRMPS